MTSGTDSAGPRPDTGATDVDESLLSLDDVAMLASAGTSGQLPRPTIRHVAAANRMDPRFSRHYEALAVLARDAGFNPVREQDLETALVCHRDFQRLLDAEGWEHPSEVLDPDGELGISYRELAHIATVRADRQAGGTPAPQEQAGETPAPQDRPEGDGKAVTVRDKLQRAWAAQREKVAPVAHFVARLLEHDEQTAESLLQQASIEYRRQRKARP